MLTALEFAMGLNVYGHGPRSHHAADKISNVDEFLRGTSALVTGAQVRDGMLYVENKSGNGPKGDSHMASIRGAMTDAKDGDAIVTETWRPFYEEGS